MIAAGELMAFPTETVYGLVANAFDPVAVRIPANPLARELIRQAQTPIADPSANKFGRISPTEARHVKNSSRIFTPSMAEKQRLV